MIGDSRDGDMESPPVSSLLVSRGLSFSLPRALSARLPPYSPGLGQTGNGEEIEKEIQGDVNEKKLL